MVPSPYSTPAAVAAPPATLGNRIRRDVDRIRSVPFVGSLQNALEFMCTCPCAVPTPTAKKFQSCFHSVAFNCCFSFFKINILFGFFGCFFLFSSRHRFSIALEPVFELTFLIPCDCYASIYVFSSYLWLILCPHTFQIDPHHTLTL